jgi:hypothetical protein
MAEQGKASHNRAILERMIEITGSGEYDALEEVAHPDFVQEIPQSGERVVGVENFRKILEGLREQGGGISLTADAHIAGRHEHYVMTTTFNVVRVEGDDDELTSYVKARYPDGTDWYIITFSSYADGKMIKRVDFFAPFFEAPEWRSQFVERL